VPWRPVNDPVTDAKRARLAAWLAFVRYDFCADSIQRMLQVRMFFPPALEILAMLAFIKAKSDDVIN
jgi:hypothetical protein